MEEKSVVVYGAAMSSIHILMVEDDALMRRSLAFSLEQAGYRMSTAASAEDGLALAQREPPDLILLDIGLPGMDGLEALHHFQEHRPVPIIFLTARRRELELGADDYVTKPFDLEVLLARIKTVLRRSQRSVDTPAEPTRLTVGDLEIDPSAHTVTVNGRPLDLPPLEFDLLYTLASEAGRVISVHDLLARVWGAEYQGQPQIVYVHMRWLREKLEEDPRHPHRIVTVRSVGYKLEPQEA
jgi:DNA-binding response OmpR family regulator